MSRRQPRAKWSCQGPVDSGLPKAHLFRRARHGNWVVSLYAVALDAPTTITLHVY
ncbi:hypothetical protein IscW_ISCW013695 [Ixodes scapularis]|uniref:Uncharacterized protein n=1 Tax=Ixodes scapularis TaxID=6945 RepID=B7QK17_IXOSC|nr:hypothetical protein IscW_ISCW013695 [Ixodes scapularis]|eukprot:XP_002415524.1 hypothetical protein IscW_ISCW013695 [Ixodes scapularis]